ncbi:myelin proteolipid protein-like [Symsagittifera roscoffensis]|uniref:myelin proteolipid protein-like n=1 Tax=Symsagittifera roscoffensis TaxID=84072 RepID=UPI00307C314D
MGVCDRIPVGSMFATVFVAVGCALFSGGAILGLKSSEEFLKDYQQNDTAEASTKRVEDVKEITSYTCYGLCAVMAVVCLVLLLRGFFSTSRDDVWGGSSFMSHTNRGRCLNMVLVCMTFVVFMTWTAILSVASVPLIVTVFMLRATEQMANSSNLDLSYYLIVPFDYEASRREISGTDFADAYDDIKKNIVMYYVIAWAGAFLCVWGLAGYLVALAGTWGVGQESKKQENYIYRRNREQRELDDYQRAQNGKYQM